MQAEDANQLGNVGFPNELAVDGKSHNNNLVGFQLAEMCVMLWTAVCKALLVNITLTDALTCRACLSCSCCDSDLLVASCRLASTWNLRMS